MLEPMIRPEMNFWQCLQFQVCGAGLGSNLKAIGYPQNLHAIIALRAASCPAGEECSISYLPLLPLVPSSLNSTFWVWKAAQQGGCFQVSPILISPFSATKAHRVFSNKSCYLVIVSNQEQWQYLMLFWGPLGPLWPITHRKISNSSSEILI